MVNRRQLLVFSEIYLVLQSDVNIFSEVIFLTIFFFLTQLVKLSEKEMRFPKQ